MNVAVSFSINPRAQFPKNRVKKYDLLGNFLRFRAIFAVF